MGAEHPGRRNSFRFVFVGERDYKHLAAWSSGMILAQGARGPGFNSRSSPIEFGRRSRPTMILGEQSLLWEHAQGHCIVMLGTPRGRRGQSQPIRKPRNAFCALFAFSTCSAMCGAAPHTMPLAGGTSWIPFGIIQWITKMGSCILAPARSGVGFSGAHFPAPGICPPSESGKDACCILACASLHARDR